MKLKNKKTGEIGTLEVVAPRRGVADEAIVFDEIGGDILGRASSIAELNAEWQDYEEEEKEYYTLNSSGQIWTTECFNEESIKDMKSIGNYFDTREEAEKAVEKLKAWKRLKDKGFRFEKWANTSAGPYSPIWFYFEKDTELKDVKADLDLLFGVEE